MNITIKEEDNVVTVNVKLSKKDLNEGKVAYGSRDAEVELMKRVYDTKKLKIVSQKRAHAAMREPDGAFVYQIIKEEPKKQTKKQPKKEVKEVKKASVKASVKKKNTPNKPLKTKVEEK